jgi:hypothetical protein
LLTAYDQAETKAVRSTRTSLDDGRVRLLMPMFEDATRQAAMRHALLVVDFPAEGCATAPVDVTFRYQGAGVPAELDFSHTVKVPAVAPGNKPARVFFPAYGVARGNPSPGFIGLEVPAAQADCVRVMQIRDTRPLPLLLDVTLLPGWENGPLHARLGLMALMPEAVWVRMARWWPRLASLC